MKYKDCVEYQGERYYVTGAEVRVTEDAVSETYWIKRVAGVDFKVDVSELPGTMKYELGSYVLYNGKAYCVYEG